MPAIDIAEFVRVLPKVELHLHLVGSASAETVLALARRHPDGGVPTEPEALRRFYAFTGFAHFLDVYARVNLLVRTGADVVTLLDGLAAELRACQVRYAEVQVTPVRNRMAGIGFDDLAQALADGRALAGSGTVSSSAGSSTPTPRSACRVPRRRSRSRWDTALTARSGSGWAGRRPGCAAPTSLRCSALPATPGCTACRMPERR